MAESLLVLFYIDILSYLPEKCNNYPKNVIQKPWRMYYYTLTRQAPNHSAAEGSEMLKLCRH